MLAVLFCLTVLAVFFTACHRKYEDVGHKRILVVWPLAESDSLYLTWKPMLEDSVRRRGLDVDVEHVHLDYFTSGRSDVANSAYLDSVIRTLERRHRDPDLVLLYGDEATNCVTSSMDRYFEGRKFLFFGTHFFEAPSVGMDRITGFMDTIHLKENIDFMDSLSHHRLLNVTQLDWGTYRKDDLLREQFKEEMQRLDTLRYYNLMDLDRNDSAIYIAFLQKKLVFLALNTRRTYLNWADEEAGLGFTVDYFFTDRYLKPNVLQVKYDVNSFTKRMSTPASCYYTACPEHFTVGDSCIGGYFVPFDYMVSDVLDYSEKILFQGEELSSLPVKGHSGRGFYINYDAFRPRGISYHDMPEFAQLRNVYFADKYPVMGYGYKACVAILMILSVALIIFLLYGEWKRNLKMNRRKQKQAREAIENRHIFHIILKNTNASIWIKDDDKLNVQYSIRSDRKNQSYQLDLDDFAAMVLPYYRDEVLRLVNMEEDGKYSTQFQVMGKDGATSWIDMRVAVSHRSRRKREVIGVFVNIDEAKQKEAQLMEAHRRTLNAQERDNFIHQMNHEIRTPLNAIVGFSQLLTMPEVELTQEQIDEFSVEVRSANEYILDLIENMLTLAHLKNANLEVELGEVDLCEFMTSFLEGDFKPRADEKGCNMMVDKTSAEVKVMADLRVLKIIAEKLIGNAIKFNKPGGTVTLGWGIDDGGIPYFYVADTGVGIPKDKLPFIFKRFYKVDPFMKGTGLGLALAYELAESAGCHLKVESHVGLGSRFTLYFCRK